MSDMPSRKAAVKVELTLPVGDAAHSLATAITDKHPESAVILYGSGNSVLAGADPTDVLFDFYVIAPTYAEYYKSRGLGFLNWMIPPNVFYMELPTPAGLLRAKYAVLSISHFEKLVSRKTFHSYFWARFAQPARIVRAPDALRPRIEASIATAIGTFVHRAAPLATDNSNKGARAIWHAGLSQSYKAELRAEPPERVDRLLNSYGDWMDRVTGSPTTTQSVGLSKMAWRLRSIQGAFLSIARLLKATATFQGGVDYIVWKIERHSGISVPVRPWERRHPFFGAFSLGQRYYRMRAQAKKNNTA